MKAILLIIGVGIWVIVLQNAGIIATSQRVQVMNTVDVKGSVDVDNRVEVDGSVDVGEVDVNITGINGWEPANYYSYSLNGKEYHSLGTQ